jgi:FkbM family methyltransferase
VNRRRKIGGRPVARIVRAPFTGAHWRALAGMLRVYPPLGLAEVAIRYLTIAGTYPYQCDIRTPVGPFRPLLDTPDDVRTVNEIFARQDYRAPHTLAVAVDVGANIGLASLYFLTRNDSSRVYCIEPDPKNLARIARTLDDARFSGRYELQAVAATDGDGEATFYAEPTGRYGGLRRGWRSQTTITVATRDFDTVIGEILERELRIDILKIDTEGTEEDLVASISKEHLQRIDRIYYETVRPAPLHLDQFAHRYVCHVNELIRHAGPCGVSG